jgi:dTDP-4-dehydrorhamnose 3,5-epimerase
VWDIGVDLRKDSPTFGRWFGLELTGSNRTMLYVPPGFGHAFVVLSETAHFLYKCTAEYNNSSEAGIRWDDPDLAIEWPITDVSVSEKDAALPRFSEAQFFDRTPT